MRRVMGRIANILSALRQEHSTGCFLSAPKGAIRALEFFTARIDSNSAASRASARPPFCGGSAERSRWFPEHYGNLADSRFGAVIT